MALLITITNAGRAEIINAQNTGTEKVTITAVAFGTGQYTPSKAQTALQAEVKRVGSIAGQAVAADTIHVMAMDESTAAYNVGEFGLISDKGTLIAVYSQLPAAGWIIQKAAPSTLLLATDIILESLDTSVIEFGDITFINPPATASVAGVTKLVNTLTSTDTTSALTAAMGKKLQDEKQANIAAGSTAQYWRGDKTWRDFATDVRAAVLTGLSTASAAAVAASDSVLSALGKLQAQVTGLATSKLDATANAVSATKLQTARTINGVAFDGSSNITVADNSKLPLAGGKLTGGLEIAYSAPIVTFTETDQSDKKWFLVADGGGWSVREDSTGVLRFTILEGGVVQCNGGGIWNLNASALAAGVVPDARLSGTYTGVNITGNAATATKLQSARTIGGVTFDGTASINLPGVNAAGNQNTSGNAATATKLQTARTINGVAFDGTSNIVAAFGWGHTGSIPAVGDVNTNLPPGLYYYNNGSVSSGAPETYGSLLVTSMHGPAAGFSGWANQTFFSTSGRVFTRTSTVANPTTAADWTTWRDIFDADNLARGIVPDARLSGTYTGVNITGNAGSATKLQTSSNIGGVAFDGTASINLPGVNAAGNQNTSGNAATATKLQTARTINGVAFDGTGNITIDGAPPGTVGHFASVSPPTGWLKANGAAVSRTTYAALFAAIGTTFGAGNGSTTFNLPDLRGEFLRGWDDGRGVDAGRLIGTSQGQAIQSHSHQLDSEGVPVGTGAVATVADAYGFGTSSSYFPTASTGGAETRPRNVALLACIKF